MDKVNNFFESTLVINWIAPIITGIIVVILTSIVGKILSIWWKNRAFIRKRDSANEKYINNILPYMIQEIEISRDILYNIKNAIAAEYQITEKYLYKNEEIRNSIVLSISNTRFMTEPNKINLINNVIRFFSEIGEDKVTKEIKGDNNSKKISMRYSLICFVVSLIFMVVIYAINPDKVDDPNSMAQILLVVGLIVFLGSSLILWRTVLEKSLTDFNIGITDLGIFDVAMEVVQSIIKTTFIHNKSKDNINACIENNQEKGEDEEV